MIPQHTVILPTCIVDFAQTVLPNMECPTILPNMECPTMHLVTANSTAILGRAADRHVLPL